MYATTRNPGSEYLRSGRVGLTVGVLLTRKWRRHELDWVETERASQGHSTVRVNGEFVRTQHLFDFFLSHLPDDTRISCEIKPLETRSGDPTANDLERSVRIDWTISAMLYVRDRMRAL